MPTKKPSKPEQPPWQIIIEEIRSQNRGTVEAVQASHAALERRIERLEQDTSKRDGMMEMAIRELRLDVRQLQVDVSGLARSADHLYRSGRCYAVSTALPGTAHGRFVATPRSRDARISVALEDPATRP